MARHLALLVVLRLAVPVDAAAQRFEPIPFIGAQIADLRGSDVSPGLDDRFGFRAGVRVAFPIAPLLGLETGIIYSEQGGHVDPATFPSFTGVLQVGYLHLPALLRLGPSLATPGHVKPYLNAGPVLGISVSCNFRDESTASALDGRCNDPRFRLDIRTFEAELEFGAGVEIGRIHVGGHYNLGLTAIEPGGRRDVKARTIGLEAGYRFPTGP